MPAMDKSANNDWKRLWQMVSGIHYETPRAIVRTELLNVSSKLQQGLKQFKPKSASDLQLALLLKEKKQEKLLPFAERLQGLLNLESSQCWDTLCYYLAKEYRGSASLLTQLISTETNMAKLLEDIQHYYSLERMIVLKIVKNMLVFYNVPNHPYHSEYREVVDKLTLASLRESYLNQLESLINELPPGKVRAGECFNSKDVLISWSERNAREINEVVHILLLLSEHLPMELEHIKRLFTAFKQHSFGRVQSYVDDSNAYHKDITTRLSYSELMLLLKCLDFEKPAESQDLIENISNALQTEILTMQFRSEHGPLLLTWMLLRLRGTNDAEDATSLMRCRMLGKKAVDLKCFVQFSAIIKHPMFSDDSLPSRIVRKIVYNQLCYLCELFDGDGSCAQYEGIYELLCELLAWPHLAKDFCNNEDSGVRSLYNTLLENFPLEFTNLANLAHSLTKAGQGNYIKNQLENLPILALMYDENTYKLRELGPDEYELTLAVRPFPRIDYILPAGTSCVAVKHPNGCYIHFRTNVNIFNVLHHEINCLLSESAHLHGDLNTNKRIQRVEAGLRFLESALQRVKCISNISGEMVHPTELSIDLLNKFKILDYPPIGLLANSLNVCTALLPLVDEEILTRVTNLEILPSIGKDSLKDYKLCCGGYNFESRFLGSIINNVEKKRERYDFLSAYLNFLTTYTKLKRSHYQQVEIPGLVFLLRDVFSHLHTWQFKSQIEKNKIYYDILSYISKILDFSGKSEGELGMQQKLLHNVCVYSLLNLENGLILLRFVGVGNSYVQHSMELETNWMLQAPHSLMMIVRLSMRILMHLLRLKDQVYASNTLSPLETLIYTQPKQRDSLRIIPIVCSYMSNIFDRWLPILSCRLLKRIALEFNMSLLASLDMEPDQIRLTFIQKLPDELESDSIKEAVLELVDACIAKQPGATEAFFKVNYALEKRSFGREHTPTIGDSIVTYMKEFLDALLKDPLTIQEPLPCRIMSIFHSLWKHNLQMLVDELICEKNFWEKICAPLFGQLQPNVRVYTQLLNIISVEIYCSGNAEKAGLKEIMLKFFERKYFEQWLDYVFDMPKEPASPKSDYKELPDWICCLQAFKDLLIILLKKQPHFVEIPELQFKLLAQKCLKVLVERANYQEDLRPFIILSELYIFIIQNFKHSFAKNEKEEQEIMEEILQLMSSICSCYDDLHIRAKEACLAIIIKCAHLHANFLLNDSGMSLRFLNSVVTIICSELQNMENSINLEQCSQSIDAIDMDCSVSVNSLILCLNLLKTVAAVFQSDGPDNWNLPFISARLFQRLLRCTAYTLPLRRKQMLSVQLLDVLIVFAKSHCSTEFLHSSLGEYLWLKLLPPQELLQAVKGDNAKLTAESWTVEQWWPIYARGIELVNIIYERHKKSFLKEALLFVGIHEVYLIDSMLLGSQSLEPAAIQLIKTTITLVANLVDQQKEWREQSSSSLCNIMQAVQGLMCHSMSIFYQQRNLKCLLSGRRGQLEILGRTEPIIVDDDVITACNELTEIIIYCVKALQKFSPDLVDLLCSNVYEPYKWEPILDIKFGAPKLNEDNVTLTFGMVLNMVAIYVKALNVQNHGFHEVPLNSIPNIELNDPIDKSIRNDNESKRSQRGFSKSLSTTSISSAVCLSNELLSNLDSHLCLVALEHLLMLVASQVIYVIRSPNTEARWKQMVRRDICSELHSYHEFVRKKVIADYRDSRCPWVRRKHGVLKTKPCHIEGKTAPITRTSTDAARRSSTNTNELRVSVVRRLHLQQHPSGGGRDFEMSHMLSPIAPAGGVNTPEAKSSTPTVSLARPGLQHPSISSTQEHPDAPRTSGIAQTASSDAETPRSSSVVPLTRAPCSQELMASTSSSIRKEADISDSVESRKRMHMTQIDDYNEDEVQYFQPSSEVSYSELSQVQLVEEDYLQLMSALFSVIPQND